MEVALPRRLYVGLFHAKVKWRAVDRDKNPISKETNKPITDTRCYKVEYIDGTIEIMAANVIAENMLSKVDEEGHRNLLMEEIINHWTNKDAIKEDDTLYTTINGTRHRGQTKNHGKSMYNGNMACLIGLP